MFWALLGTPLCAPLWRAFLEGAVCRRLHRLHRPSQALLRVHIYAGERGASILGL